MTSRRILNEEKTLLDKEDSSTPASSQQPSNITPAVPSAVIYKLLGFTFAMIVLPLGTYLFLVNIVGGTPVFGGGMAAAMANVVLIAYLVVAWKEDQSDKLEAGRKGKKAE